MFEYIKGKLTEATPEKAVVEIGGIGYRLLIPFSTYAKLPVLGKEVKFYLSAHIREDSHRYFGFLELGERDLFEMLNGISGIGPKTALALIGHMEIGALQTAVLSGNGAALHKIPGIGKKTAERLIIELKDKLKGIKPPRAGGSNNKLADALSALLNLGYAAPAAERALKAAFEGKGEEASLSELITLALRKI